MNTCNVCPHLQSRLCGGQRFSPGPRETGNLQSRLRGGKHQGLPDVVHIHRYVAVNLRTRPSPMRVGFRAAYVAVNSQRMRCHRSAYSEPPGCRSTGGETRLTHSPRDSRRLSGQQSLRPEDSGYVIQSRLKRRSTHVEGAMRMPLHSEPPTPRSRRAFPAIHGV